MGTEQIRSAVMKLDSRKAEEIEAAWVQLRPLGFGVVGYLRTAYPDFAHWEGRAALVYHAIRYARIGDDGFELGLAALRDRSKIVRYHACGLLAYSLRAGAIEALTYMKDDPDWQVRQSAMAAIFAIRERNHHLFIDHDGDGRSVWQVNPGDGAGGRASWLTRLRMRASIEQRLQ